MATTTNFGWETPDDTDLVKDGALAIRTLGNSIDTSLVDLKGGTTGQVLSKTSNTDMDFTWIANDQGDITSVTAGVGLTGGGTAGGVTLTNDMATTITAAGDIVVGTGSGTYDNLPIGTTGQVLTADTTVSPYKVKWATATSTSGLTKISSNAFSGVASVAIDGCFTSTYTDYLVIINNIFAATTGDDLQMQLRYSGTTQATDYYGSSYVVPFSGSNSTIQSNAANQFTFSNNTGSTTYRSTAQIFFSRVGNTSEIPSWRGQMLDEGATEATHFAGKNNTARTYTGLLFKSSSSNITGNITIYGLEK